MEIAYFLANVCVVSGRSNGIRRQALQWKEALEKRGHNVELIDPWQSYDWSSFDVLHMFPGGWWLHKLIPKLRPINPNIVVSPIIDSNQSFTAYKLMSRIGSERLRLYTNQYMFRRVCGQVAGILVRSEHEKKYIVDSLSADPDRVRRVGLGFRELPAAISASVREPFCLHVSSYTQPRKNVRRLMQACAQAGKRLVIAGGAPENELTRQFQELADSLGNIEIRGFVSDQELTNLYRTAHVFCLPSLGEGVGLVALEAGAQGCEVVITERGGPKDYFENHAHYANPDSVAAIAAAINSAFDNPLQPRLSEHITSNLTNSASGAALEQAYRELITLDFESEGS